MVFSHALCNCRIFRINSLFLFFLLLLAPVQAAPAAEPVRVVATFSILGDMVKTIGAGRIHLTTLVGADSDAHVYRPTPADARAIARADIILMNGLDYEGWIKRLLESSLHKRAAPGKVVVASQGVKGLKTAGVHSGHEHKGFDPHAWQDLSNGRIYVNNIMQALIAADPDNAGFYRARGAAYLNRLDEVEREIRLLLDTVPAEKRKVVAMHDAFAYFSAAYGVEFLAAVALSTDAEPSAGSIAKLIKLIRAENVAAVFVENISDRRLLEQIASETGAHIGGTLYSDALSGPDGPAATYIELFRHNTRELVKAMRGGN